MRQRYTLEMVFLLFVIALSLVGFSSLVRGDQIALNGYHVLHIITSLVWLLLLLWQLVLLLHRRYVRHRTIGTCIMVVRRNRNVHGSLLMRTALMFLVIALFLRRSIS